MAMTYKETAALCKALSDPKRLKILHMLAAQEMCACSILEDFQVTQPTLSHDLKLLVQCGLVSDRREGKYIYYSLNDKAFGELQSMLEAIRSSAVQIPL